MEEVRTTEPMIILREKGRCISSRNLLIREAAYVTVRNLTVLPLHKIKTVEREMKRQSMLCINNTPVEDNVFRLNLYSSSGIYKTSVKEDQCRIVADNRIK